MWLRISAIAIIVLASTINLSGQKDNRSTLPKDEERNRCSLKVIFPYIGEQTTAPKENAAQDESPHWYARPEWWLCILAVPTLWLLYRQTNAAIDAAKAAKDAAEAALLNTKAFIHSQRPWLSIQVSLESPLFALKGGGIQLSLRVVVKNMGQIPALAANIWPRLYLPHPSKRSVTDERDRIRKHPDVEKKGRNVIFPDMPSDEIFVVNAHSSDIEASTMTFGDGPFAFRYFDVNVMVVVFYSSTIDEKTIYQTAVTYNLAKDLGKMPPSSLTYRPDEPFPSGFEVDQTVPREALIFFNTSTVAE